MCLNKTSVGKYNSIVIVTVKIVYKYDRHVRLRKPYSLRNTHFIISITYCTFLSDMSLVSLTLF